MKPTWIAAVIGCAAFSSTPVQADSFLARYICHADGQIRQNGGDAVVQSRLEFRVYQNSEGKVYLRGGVGHVLAGEALDSLLSERYAYYGLFRFSGLTENQDYRPIKYTNHYQFKPFNAQVTNGADGGGMWGYLVLPKTLDREITAHYVFQAGSHIGGTIDYHCQ